VITGFKNFLMRGNVIDLAVAVVIGAAFSAVVKAVVEGLINPLVAALFGKPNLNGVGTFTVNGAEFSIGLVLTQVINFVLVAAVVYLLVVVPMNRLMALRERGAEPEPAAPAEDVLVLREIRDLLRARVD
jgi:large conductance mechanosensitive channel